MNESLALAVVGTGRMGRAVAEVARERGHRIVLEVGAKGNAGGAALTPKALVGVDLAIEFSTPAAATENVRRCLEAGVAVVSGTTGWADDERLAELGGLAEGRGVGLVVAPNFSLGVVLLRRLARRAGDLLADDELFDVWIEESHHAGKRDAPSGTALALAADVRAHLPRKRRLRTKAEGPPLEAEELYIASARGGSEPGTHRVVIDAPDETVELVHRVRSRRVFAVGAVRAAERLRGRVGRVALEALADPREDGGRA